MLLKAGIVLAAPVLLMSLVIGATGVVLVDVQEGGPDGMHLMIPVPLVVAQTALAFVPEEARYVECPEVADYLPLAERVLEELRDQPDFVIVEVQDGGETVLIRKVGDEIHVDVNGDRGEEVTCRLPIKGALKMLRAYDGEGFNTRAAVAAIRTARRGDIVHVKDGDDEVRIRKLF